MRRNNISSFLLTPNRPTHPEPLFTLGLLALKLWVGDRETECFIMVRFSKSQAGGVYIYYSKCAPQLVNSHGVVEVVVVGVVVVGERGLMITRP